MTLPKFPGSQEELYQVCAAGSASYLEYLAKFTSFSPIYEATWADELDDLVKKAMDLPDAQARMATAEMKRLDLIEVSKQATAQWQVLKRYIIKAFTNKAAQKIKLSEAGAKYYERAADEGWESLTALMGAGQKFIQNNLTALQVGTIMPTSFQADFDTVTKKCQDTFKEYVQLLEQIKIDTGKKLDANNACYNKLEPMFLDGQEIFKNDEEIKQQFIYERVLKLVGGAHETGLKGTIINGETLEPLEGVDIKTTTGDHHKMSDEEGRFHFAQIAGGTYTFQFSLAGFLPLEIDIELKTGVTKTIKVSLKAVSAVTA